jgi:sulfur carrier protein
MKFHRLGSPFPSATDRHGRGLDSALPVDRPSSVVTDAVASEVVITVNGTERRVPSGWTLAELLASLELDARTVVIERNGTILRDRSSFASLELAADDSLEIVHFVGGG